MSDGAGGMIEKVDLHTRLGPGHPRARYDESSVDAKSWFEHSLAVCSDKGRRDLLTSLSGSEMPTHEAIHSLVPNLGVPTPDPSMMSTQ